MIYGIFQGVCWLCDNKNFMEDKNHLLLHCEDMKTVWSWVDLVIGADVAEFSSLKLAMKW